MNISFSDIQSYKMCPKKYAFKKEGAVSDPSTEMRAAFGIAIHDCLQLAYSDTVRPKTKEEVVDAFVTQWRVDEDPDRKAFFQKGVEILSTMLDKEPPRETSTVAVEKPFTITISGHQISGRIDRIDQIEDGVFEIVDYKTGAIKDANFLKRDLQLAIYHLAVKNMYQAEDVRCSLVYVMHNGHKLSHHFEPQEIADAQMRLLKIIQQLEREKDFKENPGKQCTSCGFAKICPATRHQYMNEEGADQILHVEEKSVDIKEVLTRFIEVRRSLSTLKREEDELKAHLAAFMEKESLSRLDGEGAIISKSISKLKEYDLEVVAKTLNPEQLIQVVKVSNQKLGKILEELDISEQEAIESAAKIKELTTIRLKEKGA